MMRRLLWILLAAGVGACGGDSVHSPALDASVADAPSSDAGPSDVGAGDAPDGDVVDTDPDAAGEDIAVDGRADDVAADGGARADVDDAGMAPTELAACDGPGQVEVIEGTAPVLVDWQGGDLIVRGHTADCAPGQTAGRVRLRGTCGGPIDVTFGTITDGAAFSVVAESGEFDDPGAFDGRATAEAPLAAVLPLAVWRDRDASGDYDLSVDVTCDGDVGGHWSLVFDTASEAPTPMGDNGWGRDLLPDPWGGSGCGVGDTLPSVDGLLDQYGFDDVSLGQFYGHMLVIEIGGMWCAPCAAQAERASEAEYEAEQAGDRWGVHFITMMATDFTSGQTDTADLYAWAERFGLSSPVLGGEAAAGFERACRAFELPTLLVVDPLMQVRARYTGFDENLDLVDAVASAWSAFIAEHPTWVSPRCDGVVDPGVECGCVDDRSSPDADDDGVLDACDACNDGAGGAEFCIGGEPPTPPDDGEWPLVDGMRILVNSGYDPDASTLLWFEVPGLGGVESMPPSILIELTAGDRVACRLVRVADDAPSVVEPAGTSREALLTVRLDAENSSWTSDCVGALDPDLWDEGVDFAVSEQGWTVAFVASCPGPDCPDADAGFWASIAPALSSSPGCNPLSELCERGMIGVVPVFDTFGPVEWDDGGPVGFAFALPLDERGVYAGDGTDVVSSLTLIEGVPRALLFGVVALDGSDLPIVPMLVGPRD